MNYEREILCVLVEAGEKGLNASKIARHVFNSCNDFFEVVAFEDVHRYVTNYLKRNSKSADSSIEKTGKRGVYRLNQSCSKSCQLMLDFENGKEDESGCDLREEDLSLSLF